MTDLPRPRARPEGPRPRRPQPPRRDHLRGRPARRRSRPSLFFWKTAFMFIVAAAVVVAVWELRKGFLAKDIDLPEQPLMLGGVVMVVVAYFYGAPALVTATAVTALVIMLWLLRRGVDGYVQNATASVFTLDLRAVPRSFVALLLAEGGATDFEPLGRRRQGHGHVHRGHDRLRHRRLLRRRAVRPAPDGAGHLARRSPGRVSPARSSSASPPAGRWSRTSSTATGGSASCSA